MAWVRALASAGIVSGVVVATALTATLVSADMPPPPPPLDPPPRTHAPWVRHGAELPAYPIAGGQGTATIFFDQAAGSPDTAMTLLVLQPGAAVPPHAHDASAELLYVIEGQAAMSIEGEALTLGPGDAVRIPMGKRHEAKVVGDHAFRAVQIYAPAGPEQRFVPRP